MENLKELSSDELTKIEGGWIPLALKAAKFVGGVVSAYVATEVTHGVVKGVAGGEYVTCKE